MSVAASRARRDPFSLTSNPLLLRRDVSSPFGSVWRVFGRGNYFGTRRTWRSEDAQLQRETVAAATSLAVLTALAAFAAVLVSSSSAAPAVAPNNVGEPSISERRESVKFCARHEVRGPAPRRSRTTFAGSDATDAERPMHPTVLGSRTRAITRMSFVRATPDSGFARRSSHGTPTARTRQRPIRRTS